MSIYIVNSQYINLNIQEYKDNIYVICQFFISDNIERNNEIKHCLKKNVDNKEITKIFLLNEKIYTDIELGISSNKIKQININKRLEYYDFFTFIKLNNLKGYCALINSDIFFDDTLVNIYKTQLHEKKICVAQARLEYNPHDGSYYLHENNPKSQDTWIIHSNYIDEIINSKLNFNFNLGILGCDNHIAYLFYAMNFELINAPYLIKTFHYHSSNIRTYTNNNIIKQPYCFINQDLRK